MIPWIEKYRPNTIDNIYGSDIKKKLYEMKKNNFIPNIICIGPSGTGKTTSILTIANELINNKELLNQQVIELNASDERGIDIVRNKIKTFTNKKVYNPNFPYKIIILDEADSMTISAQQALRRIMEDEKKKTFFCFSCNNLASIIEPIQSRSYILKFKKLNEEDIFNKIKYISKLEKMNINDDLLKIISQNSDGDMRKGINYLQSLVYLDLNVLDEKKLYEILEIPYPEIINEIFNNIKQNNLEEILKILDTLIHQKFTNFDLTNSILKYVQKNDINPNIKIKLIDLIYKYKIRISEGLDNKIQMTSFISEIYKLLYKENCIY